MVRSVHSIHSVPLQEIFDTILNLCKVMIEDSDLRTSPDRDSSARFLHHFAVLCKESYRISSADDSFDAVLYYERVRIKIMPMKRNKESTSNSELSFFLDGVPKKLSLLGMPNANVVHPTRCRDFTTNDFFMQRGKFQDKIEASKSRADMDAIGCRLLDLDQLHDLAPSIPLQVRTFVFLMRSMFNGMRKSKQKMDFDQCGNKNCNRIFYCRPSIKVRDDICSQSNPIELFDVPLHSSVCETQDVDYAKNIMFYWATCGFLPECRMHIDTMQRFCSRACCIEWKREFNDIFSMDGFHFDAMAGCDSSGVGRIQRELDCALNRNRILYACIQRIPSKRRKLKSLSYGFIKQELRDLVHALNIDVGVLYWAYLRSTLPGEGSNTFLPGHMRDWRSLTSSSATALSIKFLYEEVLVRNPTIITDIVSPNRFLSRLKTRLHYIQRTSSVV